MSELIAEARVLVTPDTTKFAGLLETQLAAIQKTIPPVPVTIAPVMSGAAVGASQAAKNVAKEVAATTAATVSATEQGAVAAKDAAAKIANDQAKFLSQRTTQETAASTKRIALREAEVAALLAEERKLAAQQHTLEAQRVTAGTAEATKRISQREAEVAGILAEERRLLLQEEKFEADRVTAATAASSRRIASREAEVAALLAADRKAAASAVAQAETQAAASAAALERQLGGLSKGGASAAASLLGVRGATLAATGPFIAGAAGAIAFSKAIGIATGFNSQLAVFAATTGATADEMERVSEAAKRLGKDITLPGVSASDAAESMTEFAKAGLSVNDAIAATRGGLQLATAAQLSNADAVELTANALNAFKLSGDQAVSVADTLANAANAAQGSIADIGLGLKQAAGAAAVVGVSFKDTTALLTLLAKNGLTASDAGTSLRTAFIRLVNPSKQAAAILKDLNVNLRDAQGNVRPEVFAEFAQAQRGLSRATQDSNAAIVFGQDAFRAFGVLSREGATGLDRVRTELDQTGTAARIAGARMTGLAGSTANLKNQLEAMGLTIGQIATPALQALVGQVAAFVSLGNDAVGVAGDLKTAFEQIPGAQAGESRLGQIAKDIVKFSPSTPVGILNIAKTIQDAVTKTDDELVSAGALLRSSIEDSGREAAKGAVGFGDQITSALDAAFALVQRSIREGQQKIRAAQLGATARGAGQQAGLEEAFSGILASGGSVRDQIANLQRQAEVQSKIIEDAGPNAAGVLLQRRRAAREKLGAINQQIIGLEKAIASDQQSARDALQRIRDQAKSDADRAFLQSQEDARTRQDRLVTLADDTPSLQDDIRRQEQLRVLIIKQIAGLKASTIDQQAKQQAIRALRQAQNATTDELKRLHAAQRAQQAENKQAALDQITENLSLREQIAEARGNKDAIVTALNAQISDAQRRIVAARKAKKGVLEAILALEQLKAKKRDLLKQVKEATDNSGFSGFQFLQKTQGFAANLLGNLIPGFATGGLVGNTSAAAVQGQITDPRSAMLGDEVVTGSIRGDRGVRPVQVDTTNALLRQILAAVRGGPVSPPEIAFNRRWGAAGFDTM